MNIPNIAPTITQPRPLKLKTPARRMFEALSQMHARQVLDAQREGRGEETLPAWHAHLPSGVLFRIKWIGTYEPFVRFIGPDDETAVVLAPESVVVECTPVSPESDDPRVPIGFIRLDDTLDET